MENSFKTKLSVFFNKKNYCFCKKGYTNIGKEIGGAIVEILIGIISGLVLGFFLSFIPTSNMKYKVSFILLLHPHIFY